VINPLSSDEPSYLDTHQVYEKSAEMLVGYWAETGSRPKVIDIVLKLIGKDSPTILELGCGPGREAALLINKSVIYTGIDYSKKLIEIARSKVPRAEFVVGDMVNADYPVNLDGVIALASVIHLNSEQLQLVINKVATSLKLGGIFYMSLKEGKGINSKTDGHGKRTYFLYDYNDIVSMSKANYEVAYTAVEHIRDQDWLEIALRRL
jgi:SAM-dependent methyltransferase